MISRVALTCMIRSRISSYPTRQSSGPRRSSSRPIIKSVVLAKRPWKIKTSPSSTATREKKTFSTCRIFSSSSVFGVKASNSSWKKAGSFPSLCLGSTSTASRAVSTTAITRMPTIPAAARMCVL